jgi:hypothetical protein
MKYEEGVKNRLEEFGNKDKEINRNGKSAKSELGVQIAKLEGVIVKAEAEEEYEASKFSMPFSLKDVDDADYKLEKAKKNLAGHKSDLKSRKSLLKELF